jgi:ferredoxin, 2Fe-2S
MKISFSTRAGDVQIVDGHAGQTLMQAAVDASVGGIAADCGGTLTCATCHVFCDDTRLQPPDADELAMLDFTAAGRRSSSRLSCQIKLHAGLDGLLVELPATQY